MTVNEFVSRLDGVKGGHGQWTAKCPAHDDRRASLSVSVGEGGRVLLNCHAGCSTEDICAALGLTVKDLFTEDRAKERPQIVATYPYRNGGQKLRYSDKHFSWRQPDGHGGWIWNRKGLKRQLFVAGELSGTVFLAEGEKDCLNLNRLGYNTASGEDGAGPGKWRKEYTAELAGLSIVIFQDNDDVGKAYAQEIAAALYGAAASVRVLDLSRVWADIPEHGDVSDLITCFGDKKARELITELMQSTPEWAPGIAGSLHENKEESMKKDYIIAPECIRHRLEEAESAAVAITGLMEDVIDPAFDGYACRGLLDAWSKETGGDKGSAAVNWMEKHFDALYAACNAVNALSRQVADILQMLPRVQEKEAVQNG